MQLIKNKQLLIILSSINIGIVFSLWYFGKSPTIGVIDPQILIARFAANIAKTYPNGVPTGKLQAIAEDLKSVSANYAKAHKMLLLSKNAVWSDGLPDQTENIWELLQGEQ